MGAERAGFEPAWTPRSPTLRPARSLVPDQLQVLGRRGAEQLQHTGQAAPGSTATEGTPHRRRKQGDEFIFGAPATWGTEQAVRGTGTRLYGQGGRAGMGLAALEADPAGRMGLRQVQEMAQASLPSLV